MRSSVLLVLAAIAMAPLDPVDLFAWSAADRDFDGDGTIGFPDFLLFARAYGTSDTTCDLNKDGQADFTDFLMFVQYYGKSVPETEVPDTTSIALPIFRLGEVRMHFIYIPPGTFGMGNSQTIYSPWPGRGDPTPDHSVTISKGFYLGKYEVTQDQWESMMGDAPWHGKTHGPSSGVVTPTPIAEGPLYAASFVSWKGAQEFIAVLNRKLGTSQYRLPTEAEWEYACRAGTTSDWFFGEDGELIGSYAWFVGNTWYINQDYPHEVGRKIPNPWGFYDMYGNVSEWCSDWYGAYSKGSVADPTGPEKGEGRIHRGGSIEADNASYLRSWKRWYAVEEEKAAS